MGYSPLHKRRVNRLPQARADAAIPARVEDCNTEEIAREFLIRCSVSSGIEFIPLYILNDMHRMLGKEIERRTQR